MDRYEWLALPHNFDVAPNEPAAGARTGRIRAEFIPNDSSGHPDRENWDAVGRRYQERFLGAGPEDWRHPWDVDASKKTRQYHAAEEPIPRQPSPIKAAATCKVQVVRSICDWSHGLLTEHSIQNACRSFPRCHSTHV